MSRRSLARHQLADELRVNPDTCGRANCMIRYVWTWKFFNPQKKKKKKKEKKEKKMADLKISGQQGLIDIEKQ